MGPRTPSLALVDLRGADLRHASVDDRQWTAAGHVAHANVAGARGSPSRRPLSTDGNGAVCISDDGEWEAYLALHIDSISSEPPLGSLGHKEDTHIPAKEAPPP